MNLIILAGLRAAGKTTVASILQHAFGFRVLNVGDALRDHLLQNGIDCPSERLSIGPAFLSRYHTSQIFEIARSHIIGHHTAVLDGVRFATTCNQFRVHYPESRVWFVEADPAVRQARLRPAPLTNAPDYQDQQVLVREMANTIISNNRSLADLAHVVRRRLEHMDP